MIVPRLERSKRHWAPGLQLQKMKTGNPALLRNAIMASYLAKACDGEKLATQETHPRGQIKSMIYDDNYGALSLARSPENRLMWAHYANEYCGAVIGLDTSVAGFSCLKTNFVPDLWRVSFMQAPLQPSANS